MRGALVTKLCACATALSSLVAAGCQGSTSGSAPPPASATAAVAAPESPPAGPPPATAAPGVGAPGSAGAPDPTRELAAGTVSVAQMSAMAPGSKATVRGLFLGWRGPCQGAPPTRSAWQLADADQKGAACVYVDGPNPPGLDATGRGAPVWVRVDGQLVAGPPPFLTSQHAEKETP